LAPPELAAGAKATLQLGAERFHGATTDRGTGFGGLAVMDVVRVIAEVLDLSNYGGLGGGLGQRWLDQEFLKSAEDPRFAAMTQLVHEWFEPVPGRVGAFAVECGGDALEVFAGMVEVEDLGGGGEALVG
jgi:hypothetical protein